MRRDDRSRRAPLVACSLLCALAASCAVNQKPQDVPPGGNHLAKLHTRFCATTVLEHDIHRCLGELTPAQQRRAATAYRLSFAGDRLVAFDMINGRGRPGEEPPAPTGDELLYDGERVTALIRRDRNGVVRGQTRISADGTHVRWVDALGRPAVKKDSRASGLRRALDGRGRVVAYAYVTADGTATDSADGLHEIRPVRDARGALLEESYFDQHGARAVDRNGVHRIVFQRDALGLATS